VTEKETEQVQILVDSTGLEIKTSENSNEKLKSELEFEKISEIIKSTFEIENPELKEVPKPWKTEYYSLLDSTKVKSFKRYSDFLIIEYDNAKISESEFDKIKTIAKKSINNKKELFNYYLVFSKGGTSFNLVNKWIVTHQLRCNMYPEDYEIDKQMTSEFEKLNYEVDWIRTYCGWGKMEIK